MQKAIEATKLDDFTPATDFYRFFVDFLRYFKNWLKTDKGPEWKTVIELVDLTTAKYAETSFLNKKQALEALAFAREFILFMMMLTFNSDKSDRLNAEQISQSESLKKLLL